MRFKTLLLESKYEQAAQEIAELLETDFKNDISSPLYRGTNTSIGDTIYDIRTIRKDRVPLHTRLLPHILVVAYGNVFHPEIPSRSESKFASPSKLSAGGYGSDVVMVFPEKSANVKAIGRDPTPAFFHPLDSIIEEITEDFKYDKKIKAVENSSADAWADALPVIQSFQNSSKTESSYLEFESYLESNIKELMKEAGNIEKFDIPDDWATNIKGVYRNLRMYYKSLKDDISYREYEVMFDGDRYLRVWASFFEQYFKYEGGKWRLNDEV